MDSILNSVKDKIAGGHIHEHFDWEIIDCINAVFVDFRQEGIGPEEGFKITGDTETWADFLGEKKRYQESIAELTALKVRLMFDPPASSAISETLKQNADRLEWRLNIDYEVETPL